MRTTLASIALIFTTTMLTGCGTSVKPTFTSQGNEGYQLVCGGFFETGDLSGCYQKAGELCMAKGYSITQTNISSIIVECKTTD